MKPGPPDFGPTQPLYPPLIQVLRVTTSTPLAGTNVYPAFTQQYAHYGFTFRDREAAYVWEPNSVSLAAEYYICRLIGSHAGYPLYVTVCCVGDGEDTVVGDLTIDGRAFFLDGYPTSITGNITNLTPLTQVIQAINPTGSFTLTGIERPASGLPNLIVVENNGNLALTIPSGTGTAGNQTYFDRGTFTMIGNSVLPLLYNPLAGAGAGQWWQLTSTNSFEVWPLGNLVNVSANVNNLNTGFRTNVPINATVGGTNIISGLAGNGTPQDGQLLNLINVGAGTFYVPSESGSSSAANRVTTATGTTISASPGSTVSLIYRGGSTNRWLEYKPSQTSSPSRPSQITSDQNAYALGTANFVNVSTDAARTVNGFATGYDGGWSIITNTGSNNLTLANQSPLASPADRIITSDGLSLIIGGGGSALVLYDAITARWRAFKLNNPPGFDSLGDPGVDSGIFWDESANAWAYYTFGTGMTMTGTTLTASGAVSATTANSTSTDSYVDLVVLSNNNGLHGVVSVKNTGGSNQLRVKLSWTNIWSETVDVITDLAAGLDQNVIIDDVDDSHGGLLAPMTALTMSVKSTVAGLSTTFRAGSSSN